jgi:ribose transport system substrate-binding protein
VQHPEANAINFPFAATVSLGISGLKDSGRSDLIVIGAEGAPSQYQLLNDGTIAMVMAFPAGWTGWAAVDSLNREFAKAPQVYEGVGYKLVTAKEMNGATTFTVPVDYEAAYRKLWAVG